MGVLSNNYAQIIPGSLISASYVSDIYDVLMGAATESIRLNGSLIVTGSVTSTIGFIGSLSGHATSATSASFASTSTTASYATTSSYAITSSYLASSVLTLTPISPLPTNVLTGSFAVSSSIPPVPYFWDGANWNALY